MTDPMGGYARDYSDCCALIDRVFCHHALRSNAAYSGELLAFGALIYVLRADIVSHYADGDFLVIRGLGFVQRETRPSHIHLRTHAELLFEELFEGAGGPQLNAFGDWYSPHIIRSRL